MKNETLRQNRYVMHLHHSNVENFSRAGDWIHCWDGSGWTIVELDWAEDGWSGMMQVRRKLDFTFNTCDAIGYEHREVFIEIVG